MKIAICTNNKETLTSLYQILWDEIDCQIDTYSNSGKLWSAYRQGLHYQIIFCESQASPVNGLELGKRIRTIDANVFLIYFSSHIEHALQGYEVGAYQFLLTPFSRELIHSLLFSIQNSFYHSSKLLFHTSYGNVLVNLNDIIYLEADDKDTWIHTREDTFCIAKGLIEYETLLPKQIFFRIHRKYIVNLQHITEFDTSRITVDSGKTLPLSRRRSRIFSQAIQNLYTSIVTF